MKGMFNKLPRWAKNIIFLCVALGIIVIAAAAMLHFALRPSSTPFVPDGTWLGTFREAEKTLGEDFLPDDFMPEGRKVLEEQFILHHEQNDWHKLSGTVKYQGGERRLAVYFDDTYIQEATLKDGVDEVLTVEGTRVLYRVDYATAQDGREYPVSLTGQFVRGGQVWEVCFSFAVDAAVAYREEGLAGAQRCLSQAMDELEDVVDD